MKVSYWLVTTDHLEDQLWFKDEEDFKAAMNYVAVLSVLYPGVILAFTLMSNHVHFVMHCTYPDAIRFITEFKRRYSQYYSNKYGSSELLRHNGVDIRELSLNDESFERAVAYVQMNAPAANVCLEPSAYPWGTGNTFFNLNKTDHLKAGMFSYRKLAKIIHSKVAIPPNYLFDRRGFIAPESYIPIDLVEKIFKTPNRMNYFLRTSSKAKRSKEGPSFKDQLIAEALGDLCVSLFQKSGMSQLEESQKAEVLRQIRYRFSSDPNQLARVCGLPYKEVCRLLELF